VNAVNKSWCWSASAVQEQANEKNKSGNARMSGFLRLGSDGTHDARARLSEHYETKATLFF
jgi:hypothetical protein